MTGTRPKALVTAAVSGPGLDLLHELADLVLDSWLDQPSLRIYNAAQLAERAQAEGARTVDLTSRPDREAANRLYLRLGFARRETNVYRRTLRLPR